MDPRAGLDPVMASKILPQLGMEPRLLNPCPVTWLSLVQVMHQTLRALSFSVVDTDFANRPNLTYKVTSGEFICMCSFLSGTRN